jgi:ribosomal protein L7/L12
MRSEIIKILEYLFTAEAVPQDIKELGSKLMVEELAPDEMDWVAPLGQFQMAAQTREGSWITRVNYKQACKHMGAGEKIPAIKALRNTPHNTVGLREAKDFVEGNTQEMIQEAKRYE